MYISNEEFEEMASNPMGDAPNSKPVFNIDENNALEGNVMDVEFDVILQGTQFGVTAVVPKSKIKEMIEYTKLVKGANPNDSEQNLEIIDATMEFANWLIESKNENIKLDINDKFKIMIGAKDYIIQQMELAKKANSRDKITSSFAK